MTTADDERDDLRDVADPRDVPLQPADTQVARQEVTPDRGDGANQRDDLSVRLEWPADPADPLTTGPTDVVTGPLDGLESRLASLRDRDPADSPAVPEDVAPAIEDLSAQLDYVATELIEALRSMNDTLRLALDDTADALRRLNDTLTQAVHESTTVIDEKVGSLHTAVMSMLAARPGGGPRPAGAAVPDALGPKIEEEMAKMSVTVTEAVAAARAQGDVFADRVASELQALRRRIPVRGKATSDVDDKVIDEIVNRVADEVEIRIAATLKPKPPRKRP